MNNVVTINGIASAKEASELVLGQLAKERITKIVVILFNEPTATSLTRQVDIWKFWELNQSLPIRYLANHDCFAMQAGAGNRVFSTVQLYVEDDPDAWTLVADLESHDSEGFPFWGRFTAGPFETLEAAEEFAVKLLVREGIALEEEATDIATDSPVKTYYLQKDLDPDQDNFTNHRDLLEAWQECIEGLEWFHIFPSLKIPTQPTEQAEPLPSNGLIEQL